ncbi:MAG: hypothetical protein OXL68_04515 [Paracoccaceae bacterium]|nr:hypothetical protein [Paracoccaceae bacterium]
MICAHEREFDRVVWPEYNRLHDEVANHFEDVTDHLISRAMGSDGDDSSLDR